MIGYVTSAFKSVTGWEKSHFGGYNRMITDHPYISLDWQIEIMLSMQLKDELTIFTAEKLIKLYLFKMKQFGISFDKLNTAVEKETHPFTGRQITYQKIFLDDAYIMRLILDGSGEYAPLFKHFEKGILGSYLRKEIPDEEEQEDQPGDGEGEGDTDNEGENNPDNGDGDKTEEGGTPQPKPTTLEQMLEKLDEVKEFKSERWDKKVCDGNFEPQFVAFSNKPTTPERFSQDEIRDAENLLKLLDISFDPKSDIVHSLRAGKLDTRKIAEVPAGSTSIYKQLVEDQDTKPFTVCILADMSGSMGGEKIHIQRQVLNSLYLALSTILPEDKLFIYGHTGDDSPEIYTFCSPYDTEYAKNIKHYHSIELVQNYDGPVIEAIHKKVRGITDDRVIFISLSDGSPAGVGYGSNKDIEDMKRILEKARRDDFVTVGIGMQYMAQKNLYNYYTTVDDMSTLAKNVSQVINSVVRSEFK